MSRCRCGRPKDERPCAPRGVALVQGKPQWARCRPRRGTHGCTAEPGSLPWAAASTAPVVGWRERVGVHGGVFRATEIATFLPLGDCARVSHGHGEVTAARPSCVRRRVRRAWRRHEKRAQGPALPSRLRRTRAGVHACEHCGPHRRARVDATRAHRHGAAATKRWRRPTARGKRLGGWRARRRRRRHLQKNATQPGSMAGITSSGAAARDIPPWLEGRGVNRGGEAASSPGWPLAEVQASVKGGVRCSDEEGGSACRGSRTARWRGSRGSRGRRRAWLPRVRLLLAGGSGFAAGGAAPDASVLLLLFPFSFSSGCG
jgi:hypothetical protein